MNDARESRGSTLPTDRELAARLLQGEQEALRLVMERYGSMIIRTAFLLLRDRHWAEDVSQEVFIALYRRISQLHDHGSLRPWLVRITINECRQRMRRAAWTRLIFLDKGWDERTASTPGPEESAEAISLAAVIQTLPYKYREVIVLYYYHDLTVDAISGQLQEKSSTVKSKLARARAMLKHKLQEEG
ncbi:sigma-70 family RNA polymerase sigma factor [Paenibacillus sp. 1P07SE]|uniref:sigma-70 family RNA polymerase sigma factor n=1 Tax=Paenibacillus sp. 1P07SE TaxID=3132209 RepID=UPI0039A49551